MILTVTPNPALDITYTVTKLAVGATNRPSAQRQRAGGKGVNVARVLHALGEPVIALGLVGGSTGELIVTKLAESRLPHEMLRIKENSRRTVNMVSTVDGQSTIMNEHGPRVEPVEWRAFLDMVGRWLPEANAVVLSGSLPRGVPESGFADLLKLVGKAGLPSILDSSGQPLARGLTARPSMIKPNQEELKWLVGTGPLAAARYLHRRYSCAVIASLGADGLLAVNAKGAWRADAPERISGNPVGAGDACVAALSIGLAHKVPLPDTISDAVALSASAVRRTAAGEVDLDYYQAHRAQIAITEEL